MITFNRFYIMSGYNEDKPFLLKRGKGFVHPDGNIYGIGVMGDDNFPFEIIGYSPVEIYISPSVEDDMTINDSQRELMSVSTRQARLYLNNIGLLGEVEDYIHDIGGNALIEWDFSSTVDRLHPLVIDVIAAISNKTESELDDMFIEASLL